MARPQKNSCDYFPHDADMRNHRKVRAIRNKFGNEGYSVWVMFLEYLTDLDGNQAEYSEIEFELLSGDFNVDSKTIKEIINYCVTLKMLYIEDGYICSSSLDERLKPVYVKRGRMRELALLRKNKSNDSKIASPLKPETEKEKDPNDDDVIDTTNQINIDFDFFWSEYDKKVGNKEKLKKKWEKLSENDRQLIMDYIPDYKEAQPDKAFRKNPETFLNNKSWNDEIIKKLPHKSGNDINEKFNRADSIINAMFSGKKND